MHVGAAQRFNAKPRSITFVFAFGSFAAFLVRATNSVSPARNIATHITVIDDHPVNHQAGRFWELVQLNKKRTLTLIMKDPVIQQS
jgi:hypothetical protein